MKNMKKNIVIIVCIFLALLSIPLTLIGFAFGLSAQYDQSFYGGMKIKYDRLRGVKDKKIVIIGGSSVAFGIRSDLMEEELGIPVVNFGLYANLGTKYMLDVAKDSIEEGDIVIIAPEQNSQALSRFFNGEAVWYSADGNFKVLNKVKSENIKDLVKGFFPFVSGKFNYSRTGKPRPDGVYNVDSFNEYGDISYDRPNNIMPHGYDLTTPVSFDRQTVSKDFIEYLNEYAVDLRNDGAEVYYSFCPMNRDALEDGTTDGDIDGYYNYLKENFKFDILGSPTSRILDKEWFYDTNFHLNNNGAEYYTRQVILDLKALLDDFTPVKFPVPEKPSMPQYDPENPDNPELSQDFAEAVKIFDLSFITRSNGQVVCRIDGITEYGASLTEIEIPDYIAGIPVKEIADGAFANDTAVKKIVFGKNIDTVGKKVFDGCTSLTGVYVTSLDPASWHPDVAIFDGAENCSIYVPEEAFINYSMDYIWQSVNHTWELSGKPTMKSY